MVRNEILNLTLLERNFPRDTKAGRPIGKKKGGDHPFRPFTARFIDRLVSPS